jgi:hypothetical protein
VSPTTSLSDPNGNADPVSPVSGSIATILEPSALTEAPPTALIDLEPFWWHRRGQRATAQSEVATVRCSSAIRGLGIVPMGNPARASRPCHHENARRFDLRMS